MTEKNIDFDKVIDRKGTNSLKFDFALRRGRPEGILPLWVADMDFKTSSIVLDALKKRIDHGIFGYTEIDTEYFNVVSGWMKRHFDLNLKEEWLTATPGVVFALAMAVKAYTCEGDAVIIQQPVYYPFSEVVRVNNRILVSSDLYLDSNGKYKIDFEDFEKKIIDNNVKLFILCSPHNPVGRVWTKEELTKLGDICLKHNVIVVADEIHEDFVYSGYKHTSFYSISDKFAENSILCTAPTKTFNLAGLQIGNIFIKNEDLRRKFKKQIAAAGYSQVGTMGITACETAYKFGEEWYKKMLEYVVSNLDFVRDYVKENLKGVKLIEPEGTYLIWLDFRELGLDTKTLEDLIVNKANLWLDSGAIFGKVGEGFQRINIACPRKTLEQALNQLKNAIDSINV